MLHRPSTSLGLIARANCRRWQWDDVPDIDGFLQEHDRCRALLESLGVEVIELTDCLRDLDALVARPPNLTHLHDIAAVTSHGALLSHMINARRHEEIAVRSALTELGIPIFTEFHDPDDAFEGCLALSERTVLAAATERHKRATIDKFIPRALQRFDEVITAEAPKARRFMHPDTIYNRIDHDLALACSVVPLEPGVVIAYDTSLSPSAQRELRRRGVELILFHPEAMLAGGGSLRCLTLRLYRERIAE